MRRQSELPRPVQQPYPPIFVACFSEPTMRNAAQAGFDIIFAQFAAAMMFGSLQNAVREFRKESEAAGHVGRKAIQVHGPGGQRIIAPFRIAG